MQEPRVDIVIPVYNGGKYLRECLDSVLAQTYRNWRATVVNNCSTDDTPSIAEEYENRDSRVRVCHFSEFRGQSQNYNRAVALVSPEADYVKILEADNSLAEDCLERSVRKAEENRHVGLVGSYYTVINGVGGIGLPHPRNEVEGAEAVRIFFENYVIFGAPTCVLFRASALREQSEAFREGIAYDDADLFIRVLHGWRFAFVHRVLSFLRYDEMSTFGRSAGWDLEPLARYCLIERYGLSLFPTAERDRLHCRYRRTYYRAYAKSLLRRNASAEYRKFHARHFLVEGIGFSQVALAGALLGECMDFVLNPKFALESVMRAVRRQRG